MQKKVKLRLILLVTLSALISIFFILLIFHVQSNLTGRYYLNEGWNIVLNDVTHSNCTLSEFQFPLTQANDKISLTTKLPDFENKKMTLTVPLDYSAINVTVDGQEIYEYGHEQFQNNTLVGSGNHWISLPIDSSNKQITIDLLVTESNSFNKIKMIYYETSDIVYHNYFLHRFPAFFTCVFLIGFGILLLLLSIILLYYNHNVIRLVYIALFSILVAIWIGANYRLIQLFSINYTRNIIIEYTALYVAFIPISLFFREIYHENKNKRRILNWYIIISSLFVVVSITLQGFDLVHLTKTLYFYHITLATEVVFILVSALSTLKQRKQEDFLILQSIFLFMCFVLMDLIRFWLDILAPGALPLKIRSLMPIGILIFIICLLFSYFFYIYHNVTTKAENELLKKLAYKDILTGLSNRARMDNYMKELNLALPGATYPNYAIINMDLNRLKTVNDTFGHEIGDNYLKLFSKHLSSCFSDYGEVGRIGGDEFLVILPNVSWETCELLLASLAEKLKVENTKLPLNPISFSYGVCFSDEIPNATAKKLYRLADSRMYEMKKKFRENHFQGGSKTR